MIRLLAIIYKTVIEPILYNNYKVKIFMKSGNIISFRCRDCEFDHNNLGEITAYNINKMNLRGLIIELDQIEAVKIGC